MTELPHTSDPSDVLSERAVLCRRAETKLDPGDVLSLLGADLAIVDRVCRLSIAPLEIIEKSKLFHRLFTIGTIKSQQFWTC